MADSRFKPILIALSVIFLILSLIALPLSSLVLVSLVSASSVYSDKLFPNIWNGFSSKIRLGVKSIPYLVLLIYFQIPLSFILASTILALIWSDLDFAERFYVTFPRDMIGVRTLVKLTMEMKPLLRRNRPLWEIFSKSIVARYPRKPAFIDLDTGLTWTFSELDIYANQVANYFHEKGFKEGDTVALFMNNCAEYVGIWLGLSKIGVVTALINFNLRLEPLSHSIKVAEAKALIVGSDLQTAVEDLLNNCDIEIGEKMPLFVNGEVAHSLQGENLAEELKTACKLTPTVQTQSSMKSTLFYIYTSGTTGLPKPAVIKNARFYFMSRGLYLGFGMRPEDRLYLTMPMYHSAAGILGVGQTLLSGCTSVVRKKFSASRFWDEALQYDCTMGQYIGEICRYLLVQPVRESEKKHKIRLMYGNGLRPQIWEEFVRRFGIAKIGEFYGSTEGNSNLVNLDNHPGACGFFPITQIAHRVYPVALLKVDETTGELVRDKNGLCVRCSPGECGEMVGKIIRGDPIKDFHGYASKGETERKIIKDVFSKGDTVFTSGDILYMDRLGYLFFKDRTGDTFRWKGENVSTAEVEAVIHKIIGLNDATVYGVDIPGADGKAGMAAIVDPNENTNLTELSDKMKQNLPAYARPIFIRLCKEVDMTGTYKLKKTELRSAGFDLTRCENDKLFYVVGNSGQYEEVTPEIYEQILSGKMKF